MHLFEDQTPEVIRNRILSRLQTREGSFCHDVAGPIAFEIWRAYMSMDELVALFYVDETSGPWLDQHARLLGLERRPGTRAVASVTFTGKDGTVVPAGTAFFTDGGLEYRLQSDAAIYNGTGTGAVQAVSIGDEYNVAAGEIRTIARSIIGLAGFAVGTAMGGTDAETDASLYARIVARRVYASTSGNAAHYKEWATSCNGVGDARVTPLWNGPGTVRVMVVDYNRQPVDDAVVADVAAYIETQRPVGAQVTVISAGTAAVNVTATVELAEGALLETVQAEFASGLSTYLSEISLEEYVVRYNRVSAILTGVAGVQDHSGLLLNGESTNLTIDEACVPVVGEVSLT